MMGGVSPRTRPEPAALRHVLVAGGTPGEWQAMSAERWGERLAMLAEHVSGAGGTWLTIHPIGPDPGPSDPRSDAPATWPQGPFDVGGVNVVVRCEADARGRMSTVLAELADAGATGETLTESELGAAFASPAPIEPDLAILFGPDDVLPLSLSWELAYAEVVFIPAGWVDVDPIVVKSAVAEYFTRNRRFGGVDG